MTCEIKNLEDRAPIGILCCFKEAFVAFFYNMIPFFKVAKPAFLIFLSVMLSYAFPLSLLFFDLDFITIYIAPLISIYGIILFCYSYWKSLLGSVAVSYLAKDIYENKPVQKASRYYEYVSAHRGSYIKFLLWIVLFEVIMWCYYILRYTSTLLPRQSLFLHIFIAVFTLFCLMVFKMSLFFWAYGDKTHPLDRIGDSFVYSAKKFSSLFWFFVLIIVLWSIINYPLVTAIQHLPSFPFLKTGIKPMFFMVMSIAVSLAYTTVESYFLNFIYTRYYFDIVKKD